MDVFGSECSSGCESGWTFYFENSCNFVPSERGGFDCVNDVKMEDFEEDLSMVSDASSGPPQFFHGEEDDNGCLFSKSESVTLMKKKKIKNGGKRQKMKEDQELPNNSFLDDTASSSHVINFSSKNNYFLTNNNNQASMGSPILDFPQGFSSNHLKGRSAFQDHLGFLQSSKSGNQHQKNQFMSNSNVQNYNDEDACS